jgi:hypothetical protein
VDDVAAGKVSVPAAARIAKLPVEQQEAVVRAIEGGHKPKQAIAQVLWTSAIDQAAWVDGGNVLASLAHLEGRINQTGGG